MRRRSLTLLFLLLSPLLPTPAAASVSFPDEVLQGQESTYTEILSSAGSVVYGRQSRIIAFDGNLGYQRCTHLGDLQCANLPFSVAYLFLNPCNETESRFCINGVKINSGASVELKNMNVGYQLNTQRYVAVDGYPEGGSMFIWRDPVHGDFLVGVTINYARFTTASKMTYQGINAEITPVTVLTDSRYVAQDPSTNLPSGKELTLDQSKCYTTDDGHCFVRREFTQPTRIALDINIPNGLAGWIFGRIHNPEIEYSASEKKTKITLTATSISVPHLIVTKPKSEVLNHQKFLEYAKKEVWRSYQERMSQLNSPGPTLGNLQFAVDNFWFADVWGEDVRAYSGPDQLFGLSTVWNFSSLNGNRVPSECSHLSDKFLGVVSTNAPIYESDPPKLEDGFLKYRVAGPHFDKDQKTLFRGVYDLNLTSEFARCLYGFTSAPISATISVTNSDGSSQEVTTEVMSENNGIIHLGAYNFHFSSPTVKVKFSQEKVAQAAAPTPKATPSTKKTITCVKGSVKKKVSTSKCPTGFKKVV